MINYNMSRQEVESLGGGNDNVVLPDCTVRQCLGSFQLCLDNKDESLTPTIVHHGFWESWVTSWVTYWLRPGMQFIDVGANCGYYTMLAEKLVGPYGDVVAIEPNPVYVDLLGATKELNKARFDIVAAAASDYLGETTLKIPAALHGSASIMGDFPEYETKEITVPVTTLDEQFWLSQFPLPEGGPVMIKIDVEGAEEVALRGASELMWESENHITLLMEWTPGVYSDTFFDELSEWGTVARILHTGGEISVSREFLDSQDDWSTIVVRRK